MSECANGILKPCPFCGRDVTIRWNGYYQAPIIRHVGKARFCLMDHKVYYGYQVEDIEKLWNTRADTNMKIVVDVDKLCTKIEEDWINGL